MERTRLNATLRASERPAPGLHARISRNAVLGISTVVLLVTSVGLTSFSLFLPPIEAEFHWPRVLTTLPYTLAMVAWGISSPLSGKLADDFGTRPVILGGIVVMALGFLGMALSRNLWHLCLSFGVLVGGAMGSCGLAIISLLVSKHFDASRRGGAVSLVQSATPLNPVVFAPLLFFLIRDFDWRVAAAATAGLLLFVAFPLAWIGARDPDVGRRALTPRLPWSACLRYLRNRSVVFLFLARFSCGVAFFQIAHLVALAFSKGFELATATIGVTIFGISSVFFALGAGWLSDRYGRARVLAWTYLLRGIGTLAMALPIPNEMAFYLLVAVAIGPTFGTVAVNNVLFFEAAGPRLAGAILGLSFIVHQVGSAVGPLLGSIVFDYTGTYDEYMVAVGAVLVASAGLTYHVDRSDLPREEQTTASPANA